VRLASLPHPIRLPIAERARPLTAWLDAPEFLEIDIASFLVPSAAHDQVLLLLPPASTGGAAIASASGLVMHVNIARLLVCVAVEWNVVHAAEYR
jgi:hypothetical protein